MSITELYSLLGAVATLLSLVFAAIQRDRALQQQWAKDKETTAAAIATIRETYVQKSDLEKHIVKMESSLDRLHMRFDELLKMRLNERV